MGVLYICHAWYRPGDDAAPLSECAGSFDRRALAERRAVELGLVTGKPFHVDVWHCDEPGYVNTCPVFGANTVVPVVAVVEALS